MVQDWLAVGLSTLALGLSIVNFIRTSRIADRQFVIQFTQDAHRWATDVLELFVDPIDFAFNSRGDRVSVLGRLAGRTSALWDAGRFLFPNRPHGDFGIEKGDAFAGIRPAVLDCLKALFMQLSADHAALYKNAGHMIEPKVYGDIKRDFVSEVQKVTATRARFDIVQKLNHR